MLSELTGLQTSDEEVWAIDLSFDIETRASEGDEIAHKTYTFNYTPEWDKWVFTGFEEERSPNTPTIGGRDWRVARRITWDESSSRDITVPPEVTQALEEATGAEEITIQVPGGVE